MMEKDFGKFEEYLSSDRFKEIVEDIASDVFDSARIFEVVTGETVVSLSLEISQAAIIAAFHGYHNWIDEGEDLYANE